MPDTWEGYKDVIEELYLIQKHTLDDVRKIMKAKYGFTAA